MQANHQPAKHCFHCSLPVLLSSPPELKVAGKIEQFCCHGCQSVCEVIIASGNGDFYQHRNAASPHMDTQNLPALLNKLKIYDKPEIQADFVRSSDNWKEAYLILEEIRCAACLWLNERTIRNLPGVLEVNVDYTSQQAVVRWDPERIELSDILAAISRIGYVAHPFDPSHREALNVELQQRNVKRLIVVSLLGMMVMQIAIGSYFFGQPDSKGEYPLWITLSRWSSLVLTAVILIYPGQLFFRNAWRDLKNRTLGMDVPVALGLSVAWFGSLTAMLQGQGHVYFESIAMFVTFLLFARFAEIRARITATNLLDHSAKILPQTVRCKKAETIEDLAVFELTAGDVILIKPGEAIPVDSILLSEKSSFDESLLNGESKPVHYQQGDFIAGGCINIDQSIELEVVNSSDQSMLSNIQKLTKNSVNERPYYIDIADRIAGKFVAFILLIASATFISWYFIDASQALEHSIAVLIVTCPCALALAAPVSLSLCAAGLSRLHVIALRLSVIEKLSHINILVLDKTGTLTTGIPIVKDFVTINTKGVNDDDIHEFSEFDDNAHLLQLAAEIEADSEHPFAKAIITKARQAKQSSTDVSFAQNSTVNYSVIERKNLTGQGVEAAIQINDVLTKWRLGSEKFVRIKTPITLTLKTKIAQWRAKGGSVLFLSKDMVLQAVFFVHDPLRPDIQTFLKDDRLASWQQVILSGDHPDSVAAIAKQLDVNEAYGGLLPEEKLHWVKQKQQMGERVLMLGDGINDAPALAVANVSATFTTASDLAKSNSDLLLLNKGYRELANVLGFMKKTRSIIVQNLAWAIVYNLLALPAAALGWVTPWMAAIGMSASSLLVVMNALRLKSVSGEKQ